MVGNSESESRDEGGFGLDPEPDTSVEETEKLHKVLAHIGYGSRRNCEALIESGRVSVNGSPAQLGVRVDIRHDVVRVDDEIVGVRPDLVYFLLSKPVGYISSVVDPRGRPTVIDLIDSDVRVFPVGRLDLDSEGLLIVTNDGDLANLVAHPSGGVEKEYLVHLDRVVSDKALHRLRIGVPLDDGLTSPAKVSKLSSDLLKVTLHEGRNRQVRRMCEFFGLQVLRLVRTRIGPIRDARLAPGHYRQLTAQEVIELREAASSGAPNRHARRAQRLS